MTETAPAITPDTITDLDVQIVEQARDLFVNHPEAWTWGNVGLDSENNKLASCQIDQAEKVCAIGALYKYGLPDRWLVAEDEGWARQLINNLAIFSRQLYGSPSIVTVNDHLGREQVINVMTKFLEWREDHSADEDPPGNDGYNLIKLITPF
jgi:hypothetical protein